jgi:small redox-active disulfide protein 2
MLNIKILGAGCPKCRRLEEKVKELISANNMTAEIEKVTDINDMMKYNIMMTPGLVINEKLRSTGIIPKDEQIIGWINEEMK